MKYQVLRDAQTHTGFVVVNTFGDRRGSFVDRTDALARCAELNKASDKWLCAACGKFNCKNLEEHA